jgi:hypothetical protein
MASGIAQQTKPPKATAAPAHPHTATSSAKKTGAVAAPRVVVISGTLLTTGIDAVLMYSTDGRIYYLDLGVKPTTTSRAGGQAVTGFSAPYGTTFTQYVAGEQHTATGSRQGTIIINGTRYAKVRVTSMKEIEREE